MIKERKWRYKHGIDGRTYVLTAMWLNGDLYAKLNLYSGGDLFLLGTDEAMRESGTDFSSINRLVMNKFGYMIPAGVTLKNFKEVKK